MALVSPRERMFETERLFRCGGDAKNLDRLHGPSDRLAGLAYRGCFRLNYSTDGI
jgi:hypothetical protein